MTAVNCGLKDSDAQATAKQNRDRLQEGQGASQCPSFNTEYAFSQERQYSGKSRQICEFQVPDTEMTVKTTRLHGVQRMSVD